MKPPANTFSSSFVPGSFNRAFTTVMDFAPTLLELAGVALPPVTEQQTWLPLHKATATRRMTTFRGKPVHAIRGKSWVPYFSRGSMVEDDETWAIHSSSEPVGWELFARGALRKGDWKIVHIDKKHGGAGAQDEGWELFNLVEDPGETRNLAEAEPAKLQELVACWDEYVVECGVVWGESAVASGLGFDEAPGLWEDELDLQTSWMGARGRECPAPCV